MKKWIFKLALITLIHFNLKVQLVETRNKGKLAENIEMKTKCDE